MTTNEKPRNAVELTDEEAGLVTGGAGKASSKQYYVVQKGDTLLRIAHRFGTTAAKLRQLNPQLGEDEMSLAGTRIRVK